MNDHEHSELEINLNEREQKIEWAIQRCAWIALTLLLILIALGLFGRSGPLSRTEEVSADGGVRLAYEGFVRKHSPTALKLDVLAARDTLEVSIDSEYLKQIELEQVVPQPESVMGEEGALTFVFNASAGASLHVVFEYKPENLGRLDGWIEAGEEARLSMEQFVYP